MSLILDALRKSEAERRRGESPGLFSSTSIAPASRPDRPRVWPLLLLAAMLLLSAWLIWSAGTPGEDASAPVITGDAPEVAASIEVGAEPAPPAASQASAHGAAAAPAPPPATPVKSPAPAPEPDAAARPLATAPSMPPVAGPLPTPPASAPAPSMPAEPALEALPPLAVLDAGTRASLPPLKLSMHVYSDDPSRRFAIVDGQRIGEGARLGAGVVVQIRRDGVVIEVDGRRVLLARP